MTEASEGTENAPAGRDPAGRATDDALIEALRAGDRSAVGPLFDRYYDELFAFAERMLGDPHGAADAVQETFLRVLRYGGSFGGRGSFRGWLLRVARNVCLDLVDEGRRRRESFERLPPPDPAPPPRTPDPDIPRLRRALDALPATRREVLVLRRFHGLSYAEIGEACGISEGAARVRAHRALQQLQREMCPSQEATDG